MNKKCISAVLGGLLVAAASSSALANCKMNVIKGYYTFQINVPADDGIPGTTLVCGIDLQKDGTKVPHASHCLQTPVDPDWSWGDLVDVKATQKDSGACRFDIALTFDDGKGGGRETSLNGRMTTDKKGITGDVLQGDTPIGGFTGLKTIR